MSTALFIIKTLVELLVGIGVIRILLTVFGNENADEGKGVIRWVQGIFDNPGDFLLPILACIIVFGGGYLLIDFVLNSSSITAAIIYEIVLLLWPVVKWGFIVFTIIALNCLVWIFFFKPDAADTFTESHAWLGMGFSLATGARSPVTGLCGFIIVNSLLAMGIYTQLPAKMQAALHAFLLS